MTAQSGSSLTRLVFGAMTGTSIDALDVAAVRVVGAGLSVRAEVVDGLSRPLDHLAERLRAMARGEPLPASEFCALARDLGIAHADAFAALRVRVGTPDLIGAHGQTVYHAPPRSLQLLDPQPIVAELGAPVVSDLRAADLAQGGQGAPITPLADAVFFLSAEERRAVVNLGGYCNVTALPRGASVEEAIDGIEGFDVCACNQALDAVARRALGCAYDDGGEAALSGAKHVEAGEELGELLRSQRARGRSLGTGDEAGLWVDRWSEQIDGKALAATTAGTIGAVIGEVVRELGADRVLLAGGGVRNTALVRAIGEGCGAGVGTTAEAGVDPAWREAGAIAVLAALCADRVPITLPRATRVRPPAPVAGRWTHPTREA